MRCKAPPPPEPIDGAMEVIKSFDETTNDQAETILRYTCSQPNWYFSYPYDENLPSFAFTNNVDNITITCHYSGYWEYDNGISKSIF